MNATTTTPAPTTTVHIAFDRANCYRCGGTGRYGYHGVCYLCGGTKTKLTAAGRASFARYTKWKQATLALSPSDETLVGQRAFIPRQFVGVANGGQFAEFKGARRIVAVRKDEQDGYRVTFAINLGDAPRPWLDYDPAAKTLTVRWSPASPNCVDTFLFRAPTVEEIRAVAPTLGKGATLVVTEAK